MKDNRKLYLSKRSLLKESFLSQSIEEFEAKYIDYVSKYEVCVVIPIKCEHPDFYKTLKSLNASAKLAQKELLVICVVNSLKSDSEQIKQNNSLLLSDLQNAHFTSQFAFLRFFVLDYSCQKTLPEKQGVGFARKIGMDYAVLFKVNVIACLDADTLVQSNYASVLFDFNYDVKSKNQLFAVCNFKHQKCKNQLQQKAINSYEDFLIEHSTKLKECGTPFYPVALGPTIVTSTFAYCAVNGMNLKLAGEDFYFLQSLIKLQIADGKNFQTTMLKTTVFPSSRLSFRVLFGTGKRVSDLMEEAKKMGSETINYPSFEEFIYNELTFFIKNKKTENPEFEKYLSDSKFFEDFLLLKKNYCNSQNRLEAAFHTWFDGLKIIRAIHCMQKL